MGLTSGTHSERSSISVGAGGTVSVGSTSQGRTDGASGCSGGRTGSNRSAKEEAWASDMTLLLVWTDILSKACAGRRIGAAGHVEGRSCPAFAGCAMGYTDQLPAARE